MKGSVVGGLREEEALPLAAAAAYQLPGMTWKVWSGGRLSPEPIPFLNPRLGA